jgi:hypothetical protein
MRHLVKCWVEFFTPIRDGIKTFDIRRDDRDYQVGDQIVQLEYKHGIGTYTGREVACHITYIARGPKFGPFGLKDGYAILAITVIADQHVAPPGSAGPDPNMPAEGWRKP